MSATLTGGLAVRPLALDELPLCVPHGQAFHAEMNLPGSFKPEVFLRNWTARLSPGFPLQSDILSMWKGDELVGAVGVILIPDELDDRMVGQEMFVFVSHSHRGGTAFLRLLRAFKDWCFEKGATEGRLVHLLTLGETPSTIKLDKVYRGLGGSPTEVAYIVPIDKMIPIWED
jgi:hypothetical protein